MANQKAVEWCSLNDNLRIQNKMANCSAHENMYDRWNEEADAGRTNNKILNVKDLCRQRKG